MIKLDGGECMKKIISFGSAFTVVAALFSTFVNGVYAAEVSLCPKDTINGARGLCDLNLSGAIPNILNILLFVAFIAALIFLIYGGIRWILSGGDKEGTGKAKGTVTAALIGLAIVLSSWLLINIVMSLFGIVNPGGIIQIPTIIQK